MKQLIRQFAPEYMAFLPSTMRPIATNIILIAIALSALLPCARAEDCPPEINSQDIRHSLPAIIEHTIPTTMGVEAIADHTIQKNRTKLIAAILTPTWYFGLCDGGPEGANGIRTLVVWRHTNSGWQEIGRNSDIVYEVMTAGWANISLNWHGDKLYLEQYSNPPPRGSFNDDYYFTYDAAMNKIRLIYRKSSSLYDTTCCGGATAAKIAEYEAAEKRYGSDACDQEGFEGDIDYTSGKASIIQCKFAHKRTSGTLTINSGPIYLDSMKNIQFIDIEAIKPLTLR